MNRVLIYLFSCGTLINLPALSATDHILQKQDFSGNRNIDISGSYVSEIPGKEITDRSEIHFSNALDSQLLFNGVSLDGWEIVDFTGHGSISISDNCVIIGKGLGITGIKWAKNYPKTNYEVSLEAKRVEGDDFFCGLTFPVKESFCTFVVGGWGGSIVGLSSIDDEDAANNITYDFRNFVLNQWYKIRVIVTDEKIEAWIDNDRIVDFTIGYHRISLRWEAESSKPLGVVTWQTSAAIRNIKLNQPRH
jgi:hypothetical protein